MVFVDDYQIVDGFSTELRLMLVVDGETRNWGPRKEIRSLQVLSLAGFLDACVVALFIALQ